MAKTHWTSSLFRSTGGEGLWPGGLREPSWAILRQAGPKMAARWSKIAPRLHHGGPNMAPRWPKITTGWPHGGPKRAQDEPKMAPRGPMKAPRWAKIAHNGPRWAQHGTHTNVQAYTHTNITTYAHTNIPTQTLMSGALARNGGCNGRRVEEKKQETSTDTTATWQMQRDKRHTHCTSQHLITSTAGAPGTLASSTDWPTYHKSRPGPAECAKRLN